MIRGGNMSEALEATNDKSLTSQHELVATEPGLLKKR